MKIINLCESRCLSTSKDYCFYFIRYSSISYPIFKLDDIDSTFNSLLQSSIINSLFNYLLKISYYVFTICKTARSIKGFASMKISI